MEFHVQSPAWYELNLMAHTYSPSIWEVEAGVLEAQSYPQLGGEFKASL